MVHFLKRLPLLALAVLAGCDTTPPVGPTVTALPGEAKSQAEFRSNDGACRLYARARTDEPAAAPGAAAVDAAGGRPGMVIDGTDSAQYVGYGLQQRYNRAYVRCMYLNGNDVTLLAREVWPSPRSPWPPDPDAYYLPLER